MRFLQARDRLGGVEAKYFRKVEEFHHVDPTLPAFEPGNKRLIFAEPTRKIGLGHACRFPPLDE